MDIDQAAIRDIILPTAVSSADGPDSADYHALTPTPCWSLSLLNPKNRTETLEPPALPLWRIDGCATFGTQFFVLPLFLGSCHPARIDVCLQGIDDLLPAWRHYLNLDVAFHVRDISCVRRLGISSYILQVLQHWTSRVLGLTQTRKVYHGLPFGSRIVLGNLGTDIRNVTIVIAPTHYLEHQQCSPQSLASVWGAEPRSLPSSIDIKSLVAVRQIQDSVTIVRCPPEEFCGGEAVCSRAETGTKLWALKALTSGVKYMYHEIRTLLAIGDAHPNVIGRPVCLVTKRNAWVHSKVEVIGFLMAYLPGGGLRDVLPSRKKNHTLNFEDQIRWALQMTSALSYIHEKCGSFYSDLRLDNIVLDAHDNAVLVDFEQRGVWNEFASPEVNAIDYIRVMAGHNSDDFPLINDNEVHYREAEAIQTRYSQFLTRLLPEWTSLQDREEYLNPRDGYNIPWLCLSSREQEASAVFMLGRLLWCIFEGMSAPQRGAIWQSYKFEPEYEFPEYQLTPPKLRRRIDACTRGRRDALGKFIVREGCKLVFTRIGRLEAKLGEGETESRADVTRFAREWWRREMRVAEEFLEMREERKGRGTWDDNHFGRPSLTEVETTLLEVQAEAQWKRQA